GELLVLHRPRRFDEPVACAPQRVLVGGGEQDDPRVARPGQARSRTIAKTAIETITLAMRLLELAKQLGKLGRGRGWVSPHLRERLPVETFRRAELRLVVRDAARGGAGAPRPFTRLVGRAEQAPIVR